MLYDFVLRTNTRLTSTYVSIDAFSFSFLCFFHGNRHILGQSITLCVLRFYSFADEAWKDIQCFAEDVLESQSPNEPLQPIQSIKKPKRKLTRTMSARFSFTRSVSREIYEQQLNNSGLTDGCTPICILDTNEILESLQKATKKNLQRAKEVDVDSTDEASN